MEMLQNWLIFNRNDEQEDNFQFEINMKNTKKKWIWYRAFTAL